MSTFHFIQVNDTLHFQLLNHKLCKIVTKGVKKPGGMLFVAPFYWHNLNTYLLALENYSWLWDLSHFILKGNDQKRLLGNYLPLCDWDNWKVWDHYYLSRLLILNGTILKWGVNMYVIKFYFLYDCSYGWFKGHYNLVSNYVSLLEKTALWVHFNGGKIRNLKGLKWYMTYNWWQLMNLYLNIFLLLFIHCTFTGTSCTRDYIRSKTHKILFHFHCDSLTWDI